MAVGTAGSLIFLLGTRFRWDLGCSGGHQELGQGHQDCQLHSESPQHQMGFLPVTARINQEESGEVV